MNKAKLKEILTPAEQKLLQKLSTPQKIQTWLESIPFNTEKNGETLYSPRMVMKNKKAHCMEGALFAALALAYHGHKPLLLDLKVDTIRHDYDHVVALFQIKGHWGAISKTRHAVLRYRDPIYKSIRELVMSYFHEYFIGSPARNASLARNAVSTAGWHSDAGGGKKTLRSYSTKPFDLSKLGYNWVTSTNNLFEIASALDSSPHTKILTPTQVRGLRNASRIEIKAGEIIE